RAVERACTPLQLRLRHSLSWQLTRLLRQYRYLFHAWYAQASPAMFGTTPALDGDGQELQHARSAYSLFDLLRTNSGFPSRADLPRYSDALAVLAVLQSSQETVLPRPGQFADDSAVLYFVVMTRRQHLE